MICNTIYLCILFTMHLHLDHFHLYKLHAFSMVTSSSCSNLFCSSLQHFASLSVSVSDSSLLESESAETSWSLGISTHYGSQTCYIFLLHLYRHNHQRDGCFVHSVCVSAHSSDNNASFIIIRDL
eukprot:199490_1